MAFAQGLCAGPAMAGHSLPWPELYESEGIKPKLCSYKPVGGKSTLAHLFGFFDVYTQEAVHPGGVHPGGREDTQRWGGYTHGEVQGTPRGGKQIKKNVFIFPSQFS